MSAEACDVAHVHAAVSRGRRLHWVYLSPHLQEIVLRIGLPTHDLRELMAPFTDVLNPSDFDLRCESVRLASRHSGVARGLQGRLESLHRAAVDRLSSVNTDAAFLSIWEEAIRSGDVPGAYWAIVTDCRTAPRLSQLVSREVSEFQREGINENERDAQSIAALMFENAQLRRQVELQQTQLDGSAVQRERDAAEKSALRMQVTAIDESWRMSSTVLGAAKDARERAESLSAALLRQVSRREQAEMAALAAESTVFRLEQESERLRYMLGEFEHELSMMEEQFRCAMAGGEPAAASWSTWLDGRKVLYIGGRPNSNPSIRALVERHGGEYRRHEGAIDDRKNLLAPALAWADVVAMPLDCFDRDSSVELKRMCLEQGLIYIPLRTASMASFAAGLGATFGRSRPLTQVNRLCRR